MSHYINLYTPANVREMRTTNGNLIAMLDSPYCRNKEEFLSQLSVLTYRFRFDYFIVGTSHKDCDLCFSLHITFASDRPGKGKLAIRDFLEIPSYNAIIVASDRNKLISWLELNWPELEH